jgi:hypothetical protein
MQMWVNLGAFSSPPARSHIEHTAMRGIFAETCL